MFEYLDIIGRILLSAAIILAVVYFVVKYREEER